MIRPDPNHPTMKRAASVISEIIWKYVTTHTPEECAALQAWVEEDRQAANRLFGAPRPVEQLDKSA